MCLIIQRKPKFEIPFSKFESAILNNPDGYGLTYQGDKGLEVFRTPAKPDPDKLYRLINEELIDKDLMVHLRYTTAGATNLRNAHPFPILEKSKDGVDLRMCHNGTLGKYKMLAKGDESDTRAFVKEYVRPLFKRMAKGMAPEELLTDPFLKHILEDQLTAASVLTFMDSEGNTLICNETGNGGKQEDEWYYSNTYSFNPSHRVTVPVGKPQGVIGMGKSLMTMKHGGSSTYKGVTGSNSNNGSRFAQDCNTLKFTDKFNLGNIRETLSFTDETIDAIITKGSADLLIKELMLEIHELHGLSSKLYREANTLRAKVSKLEGDKL